MLPGFCNRLTIHAVHKLGCLWACLFYKIYWCPLFQNQQQTLLFFLIPLFCPLDKPLSIHPINVLYLPGKTQPLFPVVPVHCHMSCLYVALYGQTFSKMRLGGGRSYAVFYPGIAPPPNSQALIPLPVLCAHVVFVHTG